MQVAVRRDSAAMHIDQVRDRVKGEERNAKRQRKAGQRKGISDYGVERADREVGVFEQAEQREVRRDTKHSGEPSPAPLGRANGERCAVSVLTLDGSAAIDSNRTCAGSRPSCRKVGKPRVLTPVRGHLGNPR
jgi:hypothetical protein